MRDAIIVVLQSAWEAIAPDPYDRRDPVQYAYKSAKALTDWTPPANHIVLMVLHRAEVITDLIDQLQAHTPGSVLHAPPWLYGDGHALSGDWQLDTDAIIAMQPPHLIYDEDGNVTGSEPATRQKPNYGATWAGQKPRLPAGAFSKAFSKDFY